MKEKERERENLIGPVRFWSSISVAGPVSSGLGGPIVSQVVPLPPSVQNGGSKSKSGQPPRMKQSRPPFSAWSGAVRATPAGSRP